MSETIQIPKFEAEDYYLTSTPYEWLYQYKDDKFKLEQLKQRMRADALKLGVRSFIGLFNDYVKSMSQKRGEDLGEVTRFDGQPMELKSGEYVCTDAGVETMDRFGNTISVCCHPIMPVKRLVNADGGEERLEIAFRKGREWRTVVAEKSSIASSTGIIQLATPGVVVNAENAKALSTYILEIENMNYDEIPEIQSVGRLGWISSGRFAPYVDDLVFDGEANFKHIFNAIKPTGDFSKWLEVMKKMRAEKSPGRLFLAASFASAILEPCGLLPFFTHAWGTSEFGKTVGLMIAASVWACPKMGEYITTFNSTGVGQEMMASFLNSLPMCIDELQIQSASGIKDFDRIIYQLAEGVGRTRGSKTGGLQRINTWKNCIITNGEMPISNENSGGGAVNRIIEFECKEKVYSDLVGMCAVIKENYGFAGKSFVEIVSGMEDEVSGIQKEYYRELLKSDSTDKQAASASAILTADKIATDWIFQDGNNLTVADMSKIMAKKSDVNVHVRAYSYILDLVASNPSKFKKNDFGEYSGEAWGKVADGKIYFVKSIFDREMKSAGFSSTAFLSWADRGGLLKTAKGRKTCVYRATGEEPINCVCVKIIQPEEEKENPAVQFSPADFADFEEFG